MAAGDVVIKSDSGRALRGTRIVTGNVTLDGANPTPVALAAYGKVVLSAVVGLQQSSAPGDDPSWLSHDYSGSTLNVYAWKNTGGTDPTLVASTNNAAIVDFVAVLSV